MSYIRSLESIINIAVINTKKRLIERDEMKRKAKYKYKENLKSRRRKSNGRK